MPAASLFSAPTVAEVPCQTTSDLPRASRVHACMVARVFGCRMITPPNHTAVCVWCRVGRQIDREIVPYGARKGRSTNTCVHAMQSYATQGRCEQLVLAVCALDRTSLYQRSLSCSWPWSRTHAHMQFTTASLCDTCAHAPTSLNPNTRLALTASRSVVLPHYPAFALARARSVSVWHKNCARPHVLSRVKVSVSGCIAACLSLCQC